MNTNNHANGFEYLTSNDGRDIFFGSVRIDGFSLSQLNALRPFYSCAVLPSQEQRPEEWSSFFRLLVYAGCRGIFIPRQKSIDLETIFDDVVISMYGEMDLEEAVVWSFSFNEEIDLLNVARGVDLARKYKSLHDALYVLDLSGCGYDRVLKVLLDLKSEDDAESDVEQGP